MCCTEIPTSFLLSFNVSLDGGRAGVAVFLRDGVTGFLRDGVTVSLRACDTVFLRAGVTGFLRDGVTVFLRAGVTGFLRDGVTVSFRDVGSGWRNTCTKSIKNECLCMGLFPVGTRSVFYGCF